MKKTIYIILGIILIVIGGWQFFNGQTAQAVVSGFGLSAIGAVITGWNLA